MNLTFHVDKPIDFIYDYLTDMDKFVSIHPVISKMERLEPNRYLVHERLKFGIIPFSFKYEVTIIGNPELRTVSIKGTVMKLTHMRLHFSIHANGNGSVVDEVVTVKSILPVRGTVEKIFREQHDLLFRNLSEL